MKLKREQQRRQRQAKPKLGLLNFLLNYMSRNFFIGSLGGQVVDDSDTPEETTPTTPLIAEDRTSQYSPSISHSEEAPNDEVEEWEPPTDKVNEWSRDQNIGSKEGDEDSEEWEDFGENSGASGVGVWDDSVTSVKSEANESVIRDPMPLRTSLSSGRMKLKRMPSNTSSSTRVTESTASSPDLRQSTNPSSLSSEGRSPKATTKRAGTEFRSAMKGRLNEKDLARLEAKSKCLS